MSQTTTVRRPPKSTWAASAALVRVEARRMVRHPAPWLGMLFSAWWVRNVTTVDWASSSYEGFMTAVGPMLLGISMASITSFGRGRTQLAEDAPTSTTARAVARLLAGWPLVLLMGLTVSAGAIHLRATGGVRLGDEPGMTLHGHHSPPELLQPVILALFALALGAALVRLLRSQMAAHVVVFVFWGLVAGTYWMFQGHVAQTLTPLQVQPNLVPIGPPDTDPALFPADWLLSAPGEYQDHWARLVVSPVLAAWHDVYLLGLVALMAGIAVPTHRGRLVLASGALVAAGAVAMQLVVAP